MHCAATKTNPFFVSPVRDDVEVELVQDPENVSSALHHVEGTNGTATNGGTSGGVSRNESEVGQRLTILAH